MMIYNTTYHLSVDDARNFVIWLHEYYIPKVLECGMLNNPRLTRIMSHEDNDSECFALQWEVDDSAVLHKWYVSQGKILEEEMLKVFKNRVIGFPTLMEVIE